MEVAGVAAAAITFGGAILKLSRYLYKSAKKIKHAQRELMKLVKEMGIFANLYEDFYRVCISDQRKKGRATSSTRRLVDWMQDAIKSFQNLLDKVRVLSGDSRCSILKTLTAHVEWLFSETEVKYLRLSVSVAQESMMGFSNIRMIERIDEEIQMLKAIIAEGDPQAIQAMEDQLGKTAKERLKELKQESRNRRRQKRAISSRTQEAVEILEQQRTKTGTSTIVPEPKQLVAFTKNVERYAKKVRKQRQRDSSVAIPSSQQFNRADSAQPTNSTASGSLTSNPSTPSSSSTNDAEPSGDTSTEDIEDILNPCERCGGTCLRVEEHQTTRPLSPPPISIRSSMEVTDRHTSRRPNWDSYFTQNGTTSGKVRTSQASPSSSRSSLNTGTVPDPRARHGASQSLSSTVGDPRKTHKPSRESLDELSQTIDVLIDEMSPDIPDAHIYEPSPIAEVSCGKDTETTLSLNDEKLQHIPDPEDDNPSSDEEEEEVLDISDPEDEGPSPFHPVAGVPGKMPRGWRKRHERGESPDDHWHRKL